MSDAGFYEYDFASRIEVMEGLKQLDPDLRLLICMYYFNQWSYKEISSALNIPEGTVKSRLHRAREKLYKLIKIKERELCEGL